MFSDPVSMHLTSLSMQLETNTNDEQVPVAAFGLMLEPLTPELARELSDETEAHCFDDEGHVRTEFSDMTLKLREPQQFVTAKMAIDGVEPSVTLRHVRPVSISIRKRGEDPAEDQERKARKVSPGAVMLRAVMTFLVTPDDPATREFLMRRFKNTFYFTFEREAQQLPFGPPPKAKAEKKQKPLDFDAKARIKKITDEEVQDAIASGSGETIQLTESHLKLLDQAKRREVLTWSEACATVRAEKGDAIREDDLPATPSYILHPAELQEAPAPDPDAGDVLDEQKSAGPRKRQALEAGSRTRTKRGGKFENKPRVVKAKRTTRKAAR